MKRSALAGFFLAAVLAFWPAPHAEVGQLPDSRTDAPRMIDEQRPDRQPHPALHPSSNFDLPPR